MSQVGWRLMVASMAKISRPRPAVVAGARSFMRRTKSATSAAEALAEGDAGVAREETSPLPGCGDADGAGASGLVRLRSVIGALSPRRFPLASPAM